MLQEFDLSTQERGKLRAAWLTPDERALWEKMRRQFVADLEARLLTCPVDEVNAVREARKAVNRFFAVVETTIGTT